MAFPAFKPDEREALHRREDTRHAAGRLYDRLIQRFGNDQVFMDIDQIEPGEDFVEVINRKVGTCRHPTMALLTA